MKSGIDYFFFQMVHLTQIMRLQKVPMKYRANFPYNLSHERLMKHEIKKKKRKKAK